MEPNSDVLEVFVPNSKDTGMFSKTSEVPFPRFDKGDLIRTIMPSEELLVVEEVEYLMWESQQKFNIKTMIFTQRAPNS